MALDKNIRKIEPTPKRIVPPPKTLKDLLTEGDSKPFMIDYLKSISKTRGPWPKYFEFYLANQSGVLKSMKPEIRSYCETMVKAIYHNYEDQSIA